jgi:hypothetical protein
VAGSIAVDLLEPRKAAHWVPWSRVIARKAFSDFGLWLVVTVRAQMAP